ncbi:MFS transporter [Amycolatopsis pigmentata]|uniref:MFS transporter n=1 Tax=Amycolatopsis pigmentata TaxID=450801 RepID=A0ABW5G5S0_9PSEU
MPAVAGGPRGLKRLWGAVATSSLGDGAYLATAPLLAAVISADPVAVSLVSAASLAPWLVIGPFAGALVDRWPRRAVMITADLLRMVCLLVLATLTIAGLCSIPALAVTGFILTSGQSFHEAASQAIIPSLTGDDRTALAAANSRIVTAESVSVGFVGPPIGSALFTVAPWLPIAADAATFAGSAGLLRGIPPLPRPEHPGSGVIASLNQAVRWLLGQRQLLGLAVFIAGGNLAATTAMATFVLHAREDLGVSTWSYGFLLVAQALGATAGGWLATTVSRRLNFSTMLVAAQLGRAAAFLALAVTRSPYLAAACMTIIGITSTISSVAAASTRHQLVPGDMLGRVVSVFRLVGNGTAPFGAALGGVIASRYGLSMPIVVGGVVTLAVAAVPLLPPFRRPAPEPEHVGVVR